MRVKLKKRDKLQKSKKAVSPVIATVMLIAIVVVLALIIFLWFQSFTQEAILKFGENAQLVCEDVSFSASYSTSGNLSLSNNGNVPVAEFKIKVDSAGTRNTIELGPDRIPGGLGQGKARAVSVPEISGTTNALIIPVLRGVTDSGEEKLYVCDDRFGVEAVQ